MTGSLLKARNDSQLPVKGSENTITAYGLTTSVKQILAFAGYYRPDYAENAPKGSRLVTSSGPQNSRKLSRQEFIDKSRGHFAELRRKGELSES
jgi:hypothetical protein